MMRSNVVFLAAAFAAASAVAAPAAFSPESGLEVRVTGADKAVSFELAFPKPDPAAKVAKLRVTTEQLVWSSAHVLATNEVPCDACSFAYRPGALPDIRDLRFRVTPVGADGTEGAPLVGDRVPPGRPVFAPDDTERLQALLDAGTGRVVFPDGTFVVSRSLVISSDTHLVCSPRTVIRLANRANCPLLRNRGSEPGGSDRNITVEGGVWDGNNVNQRRGEFRLPGKPGGGDINQLTVFAGVKNLRICNLTLKDPDCYCIELTDVVGFAVENIVFDCNDKTLNQDGLHIDGYARDGYVRNLRGHTNDDFVALNSDEGDWRSSPSDILDITIDGIYGDDDGYTAVRLLSRNARLANIVIRNVYGRYKYHGVSFTHWAFEDHKPGMGHFDNILIENMFASSCSKSTGNWGMVYFQDKVESVGHVTVRNLRRVDADDCCNGTSTVRIGKGVKIDTLVLDNVEQKVPDGKPLVWRAPEAEVRRFVER